MDQNELYHHGIKGQKWGERKYQYADGSLTPAGKKRYGTKSNYEKVLKAKGLKAKVKAQKIRDKQNARTEAEIAKYKRRAGIKEEETTTAVKPKTSQTKPHVKTLSEMTNEEIQERIDRINLENRLKALTPHQKTRGEKIVDGIKDMTMDTIKNKVVPGISDMVMKKLKEQLGIKDDNGSLDQLAKAAKRAGYEKQIAEAEITKRKNENEKNQQNQNRNQNQENNNRNQENNNRNQNQRDRDSDRDNNNHDSANQNDTETFRGTVEGEGTSRRNPYESRNNNSTRRQYTEEDAVDGEYRDLVDDDHRIEQQNSGPPAIDRRRRLRHSEIGEEFVNLLNNTNIQNIKEVSRLNRDELMHTAIYHGDEFSDELYHWKYIDKYKNKLGKWVYVYKKKIKDALGYDERDRMNEARKKVQEYGKQLGLTDIDNWSTSSKELSDIRNKAVVDYKRKQIDDKEVEKTLKMVKDAEKAFSNYGNTIWDYNYTALGYIERGKDWLNNLFKK